jgi:hypothetical protein
MGLKILPYQTIWPLFLLAEEMIRGEWHSKFNIFRWEKICLNLAGSEGYDPQLAWVSKVHINDQLAVDFFTYLDDIHGTQGSKLEPWLAARRAASVASYLGIQDALRKWQGLSQKLGASAGSVVHVLRAEDIALLMKK